MNWQAWGVISGFIGLFCAIVGQTMYAAYWAGVFTTRLKSLTDAVEKLQSRDDLFVKRDEYLQQVANRNKELSDIWKAHNALSDKFNDFRAK